jgi:FAD dependent monooxygenase
MEIEIPPNLSFGANCALEDAASLTNGLHLLLRRTSSPSTTDLEEIFAKYEKECKGRSRLCMLLTATYTRFGTWQNWFFKFACLYLLPAIGGVKFVADWVFSIVPKHGVKLNFIPEIEAKVGKVAYSR